MSLTGSIVSAGSSRQGYEKPHGTDYYAKQANSHCIIKMQRVIIGLKIINEAKDEEVTYVWSRKKRKLWSEAAVFSLAQG
jgi:hypothetical protein